MRRPNATVDFHSEHTLRGETAEGLQVWIWRSGVAGASILQVDVSADGESVELTDDLCRFLLTK